MSDPSTVPPSAAEPASPAPAFDAVLIAASLGGPQVLAQVLHRLPADFPAAVLVVQHVNASVPSYLPTLLARSLRVAVKHATPGEPIRAGTVYVAPPGHHLLVTPDLRCAQADTPRVSFARPSADVLFATAAEAFGSRALAVVLTGRLSDGTAGAAAIHAAGGVVLAQDPRTCREPDMPRAAIERGVVDLVLPPAALGAALVALVMAPGARALFGLGPPRRTAA